jgi:cytochrome c553
MKRLSVVAFSLFAGVAQAADAPGASTLDAPVQPYAAGIESPNYIWNEVKGEELMALRAKGDPEQGKVAFIVCQGCHGPDAPGDEAGFYPRLAGQHASVLIKQLADVRAGRRDNPKMYPFANEHVITPQDMADIAMYLYGLPVPERHGQGAGTDLAVGAKLYKKDCENCHGAAGAGDERKFYPRIQGQHYKYLLRQATDIRDGTRRNANPDMVKVIKDYSNTDVEAVIDYISHMQPKGG